MVDSHYVTVTGTPQTVTLDKNYKLVEVCSLDGAAAFSVAVDPDDDFVTAYAAAGTYPHRSLRPGLHRPWRRTG